MKKAWSDLKSFATISMIGLLYIIVIANLYGMKLDQQILLIVTNLISSTFTYYFARKENKKDLEGDDTDGEI